MDPIEEFRAEVFRSIERLGNDKDLRAFSRMWIRSTQSYKYSYNFSWLGRPIIQFPQDMVAVQELVWRVKPDLIIETGIAHGGSLVLSASMLALLDYCEAAECGKRVDPLAAKRKVVGIDIEIRPHNRAALDAHPLRHRIELLEGSSVAPEIVRQVHKIAQHHEKVMVFLDSNHTHEHVLAELDAYAPLVTPGSYCVVFDTIVEHMPDEMFDDRPWNSNNNPATAVRAFLANGADFEVDRDIENKLLITVCPGGFLRRNT